MFLLTLINLEILVTVHRPGRSEVNKVSYSVDSMMNVGTSFE